MTSSCVVWYCADDDALRDDQDAADNDDLDGNQPPRGYIGHLVNWSSAVNVRLQLLDIYD